MPASAVLSLTSARSLCAFVVSPSGTWSLAWCRLSHRLARTGRLAHQHTKNPVRMAAPERRSESDVPRFREDRSRGESCAHDRGVQWWRAASCRGAKWRTCRRRCPDVRDAHGWRWCARRRQRSTSASATTKVRASNSQRFDEVPQARRSVPHRRTKCPRL